MSKAMYETQHVTNISNNYSKKNTTVHYERHKGVTICIELDEARTIRFHQMVISLCEEQRFEIEQINEDIMPPMEAAFERLSAPSKPQESTIDADFDEEISF